ncbi:MAG: thiamine-phosphate kinase [Burkholderiales bacterium]|nr:thiamine-phosphate kinase [Burkholderiales bacterium]
MMSEFDLIARYFTRPALTPAVSLAVGDDCALLKPRAGHELAISTDMLVEGRHFFQQADANALGHKSLAVNLSDLAAMGAQPLAFTLALALPSIDESWLSAFSNGLFALAEQHNIALIGGDTTKGPLTISITIFGEIPTGKALRRNQARVGDDIWVSGTLGDARLALSALQAKLALDANALNQAAQHLHRPTPRNALGLALRDIAHAAIDVSDGLLGDLQHVLKQSNVGATLQADDLPLGEILKSTQTHNVCHEFAMNGGDDYELCFTAPAAKREAVQHAAAMSNTVVTRIGQITAARELKIVNAAGVALAISSNSYDHFTFS